VKILLVFATSAEADILKSVPGLRSDGDRLFTSKHELSVLIAGVGGISTAWAMKQWLSSNQVPDLAINAGIAGSFSRNLNKGDVVMPVSDCFADLGIEIDGKYHTLPEAGLADGNEAPFEDGFLLLRNRYFDRISSLCPSVKAVTVNTATGSPVSIERIIGKFNPDIETMEGATFFYICTREKIPFLAIRAISNYVEPGRRSLWEIPLALKNLAGKMGEILNIL
jgi:futalosine hydrolase